MDHKNPVSDTGDGVLYLDIMKKHAICFDYRFWQVIVRRETVKFGVELEHIIKIEEVQRTQYITIG
jgi:hypothetical protein